MHYILNTFFAWCKGCIFNLMNISAYLCLYYLTCNMLVYAKHARNKCWVIWRNKHDKILFILILINSSVISSQHWQAENSCSVYRIWRRRCPRARFPDGLSSVLPVTVLSDQRRCICSSPSAHTSVNSFGTLPARLRMTTFAIHFDKSSLVGTLHEASLTRCWCALTRHGQWPILATQVPGT